MKLEQLFIYFLLEEFGGEASAPVCELLQKRNFDLGCLFEWENLSLLIPLVIAIVGAITNVQPKGCKTDDDNCDKGWKGDKSEAFNKRFDGNDPCWCKPCLRPIASIANDKILNALDGYLT